MEKVKVYFTELQQEEIMEIMNQERIEKQDVKLAVAFFKLSVLLTLPFLLIE